MFWACFVYVYTVYVCKLTHIFLVNHGSSENLVHHKEDWQRILWSLAKTGSVNIPQNFINNQENVLNSEKPTSNVLSISTSTITF